MKGRAFPSHDHIGQQRVFGMDVCAPFDRRDHRYTDVSEVLQNLGAFIVNLTPNGRVTYITERRKVDIRDELCARTS